MVQFNELHITSDGKTLIIDVSVKDLTYYENVYLDSIQIETQDTFGSANPCYTKTIEKDGVKNIKLELGTGDLLPSLTDNLFFVYVRTKGTPAADTPCGMDNVTTLGVTLYLYNIYCGMLKTLQLEGIAPCTSPKAFVNEFFKYKGLQLSILTGNYESAIKYFKSLSSNKSQSINATSKCGCHGS